MDFRSSLNTAHFRQQVESMYLDKSLVVKTALMKSCQLLKVHRKTCVYWASWTKQHVKISYSQTVLKESKTEEIVCHHDSRSEQKPWHDYKTLQSMKWQKEQIYNPSLTWSSMIYTSWDWNTTIKGNVCMSFSLSTVFIIDWTCFSFCMVSITSKRWK